MDCRNAAVAAAAIVLLSASHAAEAGSSIYGEWRITRGVVAPWADEAKIGAAPSWIGERVAFRKNAVEGPGPLACGGAAYKATNVPGEGLFQGAGLAPPDLNRLGLDQRKRDGVSLTCDKGIFEFHRADAALLLALDNRIWTLDRTPGTRARADEPEGVVQRFLETHFAGDMGFSPKALAGKRGYLTKSLNGRLTAYFAHPWPKDEVPPIDGDPFTNSQEYPARFSVGAEEPRVIVVDVPVELADAFGKRTVVYRTTRERGRWMIDDVAFEDGGKLSDLLTVN